jgi:hypothetical protein
MGSLLSGRPLGEGEQTAQTCVMAGLRKLWGASQLQAQSASDDPSALTLSYGETSNRCHSSPGMPNQCHPLGSYRKISMPVEDQVRRGLCPVRASFYLPAHAAEQVTSTSGQ